MVDPYYSSYASPGWPSNLANPMGYNFTGDNRLLYSDTTSRHKLTERHESNRLSRDDKEHSGSGRKPTTTIARHHQDHGQGHGQDRDQLIKDLPKSSGKMEMTSEKFRTSLQRNQVLVYSLATIYTNRTTSAELLREFERFGPIGMMVIGMFISIQRAMLVVVILLWMESICLDVDLL
ncbi:hypothetical protein BDF22DRAFT_653210 [Syncephalis plumigaleata]|nr:hypothetical protein BDF22DRAFT_653210 [Syncephalis plumigaleata]